MNRIELLIRSKELIEDSLNELIIATFLNENASNLKITLRGGIAIYIRYNDYEEYSYTIQFSLNKLDRIRFDNFDKEWKVDTKPHHVHWRNNKLGNESPMNGNPSHDMPILIKNINEYVK